MTCYNCRYIVITYGINFSNDDVRSENPKLVGRDFQFYLNGAKEVKNLADEIGKPMNELAFNWLISKPEVTSIIAGASNIDQLEKNIASINWSIDDEVMKKIDIIVKPFENV